MNDTIKDFYDRLLGPGFMAFAPDLYCGKIADAIHEAAFVTLYVFDFHGRKIETPANTRQPRGRQVVTRDTIILHREYTSYRISAVDFTGTKKIRLLK